MQDPISHCLAVVDKALREIFPSDFDQRCLYAVSGLQLLLKEAGFTPEIVGGDFLCFVLSVDNRQGTLQGFGNPDATQVSHYWIEANGSLIDLGPSYLPKGSRFPALPIPVARWPLDTALPAYLRYREHIRFAPDVVLQSDLEIQIRMENFLNRCREINLASSNQRIRNGWELKGPLSLLAAARNGDRWARGTTIFTQRVKVKDLPF